VDQEGEIELAGDVMTGCGPIVTTKQ